MVVNKRDKGTWLLLIHNISFTTWISTILSTIAHIYKHTEPHAASILPAVIAWIWWLSPSKHYTYRRMIPAVGQTKIHGGFTTKRIQPGCRMLRRVRLVDGKEVNAPVSAATSYPRTQRLRVSQREWTRDDPSLSSKIQIRSEHCDGTAERQLWYSWKPE